MFNRMAYTESASQSETAILRELADARADAAAREATLDAKRAEVAALKAEAVATVDRTRTLEAAAVRAEAHSAGLVRAADEAAKVIAAERAAEIRRMQEAQVEADKISALLAERARQAKARAAAAAAAAARAAEAERARAEQERQRSSGGNKASQAQPRRQSQPAPPASAGSILMRPVDGPVSSPFGMRVHPITGVYKLHDGTDFGGGCGTPIYAAASGTVIESGYYGAWGNRAVVDHGLVGGVGLATAYNHMTTIVATSGSVRRGDLVGYMGSTATPPGATCTSTSTSTASRRPDALPLGPAGRPGDPLEARPEPDLRP
jgi:murein DD-endopeptidase MepM/ murein hydrolase activator NlpD